MNLKLTPADVSAIEQREQKATPGEWKANLYLGNTFALDVCKPNGDRVKCLGEIYTSDATFIAATRQDIPNLVHDWRVLSQRVQELEKVLEWYAGPAFAQFFNWNGMRKPYPILDDQGQKAREVLNKK